MFDKAKFDQYFRHNLWPAPVTPNKIERTTRTEVQAGLVIGGLFLSKYSLISHWWKWSQKNFLSANSRFASQIDGTYNEGNLYQVYGYWFGYYSPSSIVLFLVVFGIYNTVVNGRKSGLVVGELDSRSKGCGFESRPKY